jgi:hypothetical protein
MKSGCHVEQGSSHIVSKYVDLVQFKEMLKDESLKTKRRNIWFLNTQ